VDIGGIVSEATSDIAGVRSRSVIIAETGWIFNSVEVSEVAETVIDEGVINCSGYSGGSRKDIWVDKETGVEVDVSAESIA